MRAVLFLISFICCVFIGDASESLDVKGLLRSIETEKGAEISYAASKKLMEKDDAPALVTVYTADELNKFRDLYDAIDHAPGFHVDGGHFTRRYINTRGILQNGFNNEVLVIINGFRIDSKLNPVARLDIIPKESVKRMELVRGPGSVLFGSNAFSAVINIETYDGESYEDDSVSVTLGQGYKETTLNLFEGPNEPFHYFSFSVLDDAGYARDNEAAYQYYRDYWKVANGPGAPLYGPVSDAALDDSRVNFLGVSGWDNLKLTYGYSRVDRDFTYNDQRPSGLLRTPAGHQSSANNSRWKFFGAHYTPTLKSPWRLELLSKYAGVEERMPLEDSFFHNMDYWSRGFEFEVKVARDWEKTQLVAGFNREHSEYRSWLSGNVNYITVPENSHKTQAAYIQVQHEINSKLELMASMRYKDHELQGSGSVPKYALIYKPDKKNVMKAIYGKAFRFPSPWEKEWHLPSFIAPNIYFWRKAQNLTEEEIVSMEYSWTHDFSDVFRVVLTRYDLEIKDKIWFGNSGSNFIYNYQDPLDDRGWELEFHRDKIDGFSWWAHCSFMKFENKVDPTDQIDGAFERMGSLGLDWEYNSYWSFSAWSKFMGSREDLQNSITGAALPKQGGYGIHNFQIEYSHDKNHKFDFTVYNLFDKEVSSNGYAVTDLRMALPPATRQILVSYQIRF